jgi:hypothetical protein
MNSSNLFRGSPYQRGYGLGSVFRRFFNWATPLARTHLMPIISHVGKAAINTVADIAKDTTSGRNFRDSARDRINATVDSLKQETEKKLRGEGIKRKRKSFKKYVILKKQTKNYPDIFDQN